MKKILLGSVITIMVLLGVKWFFYQVEQQQLVGVVEHKENKKVVSSISNSNQNALATSSTFNSQVPMIENEDDIKVTIINVPWQSEELTEVAVLSERQQYFDYLKSQSHTYLLDKWIGAVNTLSSLPESEYDLTKYAFSSKLRQVGANDPVYQTLRQLALESNDINQQVLLVDLLKEAATPTSLEILLQWLSKDNLNNSIKIDISNAIASIGENKWDDIFHSELFPVLQTEWNNSITSGNTDKISIIASGIVSIGNPEGVDMLMQHIQSDNSANSELIRIALYRIRNPDSIPVFEKYLAINDSSQNVFLASGEALASMGDQQATQVLLNWAVNAKDSDTPIVANWFKEMRDLDSLNLAKKTIEKSPFVSTTVKNVINTLVLNFDNSIIPLHGTN